MQKKSKEQIQRERREAYLKEVLCGAFNSLENTHINALEITHVSCSKGKHNAKIYVNNENFSKTEINEIKNAFKKIQPFLKEYVLSATSWYHSPSFTLEFDDSLQAQNRLDEIFKQIHKDSNVKSSLESNFFSKG